MTEEGFGSIPLDAFDAPRMSGRPADSDESQTSETGSETPKKKGLSSDALTARMMIDGSEKHG